jgi:hypothetical protein
VTESAAGKSRRESIVQKVTIITNDVPTGPAREKTRKFPLVEIDRASAKLIANTGKGAAWSFKPVTVAPGKPLSPMTMSLKRDSTNTERVVDLLFSAPQSPVMAVVSQDGNLPGNYRFERLDLITGKGLDLITLPPDTLPLALSPDGNTLLCKQAWPPERGDRVDWFQLKTGTANHIASWLAIPEDAFPTAHGVKSAAFIDAAHVFIQSSKGAGLWKLDAGKPTLIYSIEGLTIAGPPTILASNTVVAVPGAEGDSFHNALTGDPVGFIESTFGVQHFQTLTDRRLPSAPGHIWASTMEPRENKSAR